VSLAGRDHPALVLKWRYDLEPGWDYGLVFVSDDNGYEWDTVADCTGTSGGFDTLFVDLSAYAGKTIQLSLGLHSDNSGNSESGYDGVWVDDLQVIDITDVGSGTYEFMSGTSMATPAVAGVAGLAPGTGRHALVGDTQESAHAGSGREERAQRQVCYRWSAERERRSQRRCSQSCAGAHADRKQVGHPGLATEVHCHGDRC